MKQKVMYKSIIAKFEREVLERQQSYSQAQPYPHTCIDGLFDPELLDRVIAEFPESGDASWEFTNNQNIQVKLRSNWKDPFDIPENAKFLVDTFNSGPFLRLLAKLTGIEHLISDSYYTGGGLNSMPREHYLAVHSDGNWHDDMAVHRRLNVILFLNKEWKEEWNGHFEFWSRDLETTLLKITPAYNRLFIFTTNDYTYHGVPKPILCPAHVTRKSLITYYYTSAPRESEEIEINSPHRALWKRPVQL